MENKSKASRDMVELCRGDLKDKRGRGWKSLRVEWTERKKVVDTFIKPPSIVNLVEVSPYFTDHNEYIVFLVPRYYYIVVIHNITIICYVHVVTIIIQQTGTDARFRGCDNNVTTPHDVFPSNECT